MPSMIRQEQRSMPRKGQHLAERACVAITPLAEIQAQDVGRGAAVFDAWLREVSAGHATLERLKAVAGNVPVAGNSIALIEALGAITTLARTRCPTRSTAPPLPST
jgi:predicted phage gp36 major capsid-like protein